MNEGDKCYSMPDDYVVIPRDDWFIFFDPVHFSFTRVNEHGKTILESIGTETPASEVVRKVASIYSFDPNEIQGQVIAFLDNMTSTKFLHEGPYKPDIMEPPDMSKGRPGSLYFHPTFKCNQRCIYCFNKKDREESTGAELTTEQWSDVFEQAKEFGIRNVIFTGGEPLLREDVFELAHRANSIGLSSQLLTNARPINKRNIDRIMSSFGTVGFSLDSHIEERNDFLRGKGAYRATIDAMKMLKKNNHTFSAKAVITKHNVWDLPGLVQFFLEEFESGSIIPNMYIPPSRDMLDLLPGLDDYMQAMEKTNEVIERHYGDDKISVLRFHGVPARQFQCGAAAGEISIAPDGSVYPCQALHKAEFNAGNIKEQSLQEIYYNSPIMQEVRNCTVDNIETCRDCDVKYLCGGGCRSLAYNLYGTIDCFNAYSCEYLKTLAHGILWNATCIPIDQIRELQEEVNALEKSSAES
jgi:radical SAM protein with 4Fe4S-binding SPASM domain